MKKLRVVLLSMIFVLSGAFAFVSSAFVCFSVENLSSVQAKYVTNIEKTSVDNVDYYTIHYSDSTSNIITVPNSTDNYVVNIVKAQDAEIYTLVYFDGTTSTLDLSQEGRQQGITSIEKSTNDNVDTYTFHYSNGRSLSIPVLNESTLNNNSNISLLTLLQRYCAENNIDFNEYIDGKLTVDHIKSASNTALRSSVSVWCVTKYIDNSKITYDFFTGKKETTKSLSSSAGAGTIYKVDRTADGQIDLNGYAYIITNYHVVYSEYSTDSNKMPTVVKIFQYGTDERLAKTGTTDSDGYPEFVFGSGAIDAEVIGGTEQYDIAILKVKNSDLNQYNSGFQEAKIAADYDVAEQCIAIGNPDAMGLSVTQGIVSVYSEKIDVTSVSTGSQFKIRVMRIDAPVNSGNSGGGLFNTKGELIGVVNAKSTVYDEMNYALPIGNVTKIADNIIDGHLSTSTFYYPKKLVLGITINQSLVSNSYNEELDKHIQTNSVIVIDIMDGAYAEGILQLNDEIKSITIQHTDATSETYQINTSDQLSDILFAVRAGDSLVMFGNRGEQTNLALLAKTVNASDLTVIK